MRVAPLVLRPGDRPVLMSWADSPTIRAAMARRARIVLLAADGVSSTEIASRVHGSPGTVWFLRTRYEQSGVDGLVIRPQRGRRRTVDRAAIIAATLRTLPEGAGVPYWSSRSLAAWFNTSSSTVAKAWREAGVQPGRRHTLTFRTDPMLVGTVTDILAVSLAPTGNTVVLRVDDKTRTLDPTPTPAPVLRPPTNTAPGATNDSDPTTTPSLGAALTRAFRAATSQNPSGHEPETVVQFLRQVALAYPTGDLHLVTDTDPADQGTLRAWLKANPRIHLHTTPTTALWMSLVEIWVTIIEEHAGNPDARDTARDLASLIRAIADNDRHPARSFAWISRFGRGGSRGRTP